MHLCLEDVWPCSIDLTLGQGLSQCSSFLSVVFVLDVVSLYFDWSHF